MPVLLVRHAQALPRSSWKGDDRARTLSSRGRKQAQALVPVLSEFKPQLVFSSPYVRCVETVAPLSEAIGVDLEAVEALAEGDGRAAVELVRSLARQDVLLCTHGDIIPEILSALASGDGLDLGRNPRQEKGSVWVLETRKGRFVKAKYLRPPG
jgi:broad specificity phosphatase PhoE